MKIENATHKDLLHTLVVSMSSSEIESNIKKELETLGKNIQVDGFRKGKVPLAILSQKFSSRALSEVLRKAPEALVHFALHEKKIKPALQPEISLEAYVEGKPLLGTITVEALPQIKDVHVEGLKLEKVVESISDEQRKHFKSNLKAQLTRREKAQSDAVLKKGDAVLLKCEIHGKTGDLLGDYKALILEYPMGTEAFGKNFETALQKLKVGDKFKCEAILPPGFKGSKTPQEAVVSGIFESHDVFTEPTDAELLSFLELKDSQALDDFLGEKITKVNDEKSNQYLKRQILDLLSQTHDFLVPQGMVQLELKTIWNEFLESAKDPSSEEALLLKEKSKEDILKEYEDIAERRVRLGLLLAEVGNRQGIKISNEEFTQAVYNYARQFLGEEEKVLEFYRKNPNQTAHLQAQVYEGKVINYIISKANTHVTEMAPGTLDRLLSDEDTQESSSVKTSPKKASQKESAKNDKDSSSQINR